VRLVPPPDDGFDDDDYTPEPDDERGAVEQLRPLLERGDDVELGGRLLGVLGRRGRVVYADGSAYVYSAERGLYVVIDRAEESRIVQSYAGAPVRSRNKGTPVPLRLGAGHVRGAIDLAHDQASEPLFFSGAPAGVAFSNGWVTVGADGIQIAPHSPDHRARHAYDFDFEPGSVPSRLLTYFAQVFEGDDDASDKVRLLREHAGLSLLGLAPLFQSCVLGIGEGSNGKSVWNEVAQWCMPIGSVCAIPPQLWADQYRRAQLAGMLFNVVSELPESDILDSAAFKAIVVGDSTNARHIYGPPFDFRPRAGHLFSANTLPGTRDQTHSFWRRFIIVSWNRRFERGAPGTDTTLAQKLMAERNAIVPWLLEGAREALTRGHYTVPESHAGLLEAWRRGTDSVAEFFHRMTEPLPDTASPGHGITPTTLYGEYREWARANGLSPVSSQKFGGRAKRLGYGSEHGHGPRLYRVRMVDDE